jgi:hypothetical protein
MPRLRKNDPGLSITPLVEQFAARLGQTLERFITGRIAKETKDLVRRGGAGGRRRRAKVLCYYPNCKNVAAPRFGMFCAALHKGISKAEKEKYRALRLRTSGANGERKGASPRKAARKGKRPAGRARRNAARQAARTVVAAKRLARSAAAKRPTEVAASA